jgi:hypothetical protein
VASRGEFPIKLASGELDGNNFTTRRWSRFLVRAVISCFKIRGCRMRDMALMLRVARLLMVVTRVPMTCMLMSRVSRVLVSGMTFHW